MDVDKSIMQLQETLDNIADAIINQNKLRAFEIKGVIGNLGILRQYLSEKQPDQPPQCKIDYSNHPCVLCGKEGCCDSKCPPPQMIHVDVIKDELKEIFVFDAFISKTIEEMQEKQRERDNS